MPLFRIAIDNLLSSTADNFAYRLQLIKNDTLFK